MSLAIVGVAGTVIGAGATIYSASQAGKGSGQSRSTNELGGLPYEMQIENARAYAEEQLALNRGQADLALQYGPLFAGQQRDQTRALTQELLKLYPSVAGAERRQTSRTRTADLGDFRTHAGGWYDALSEASPGYAAIGRAIDEGPGSALLDRLNAEALYAGPSPLRAELERQALAELQLGGALSPEEQRMAEQSARGAWSDRGLLYSNPAAVAEVLNRDSLYRSRLRDRQQLGATVQGLAMNEDTTNRNFAMGVQGANEASAGNWRNFLVAGSQAQLNPILAAGMGRAPVNPLNLAGLYSTGGSGASQFAAVSAGAPSIYQGVQALTPLYDYGGQVAGTNFAAAESRANAQANAIAALGSGAMNLGGRMLITSQQPKQPGLYG